MRDRRSGGIWALALACLAACCAWGGGGQSGNAPVTPAIAWPVPASIPVGTALSSAQLNATVRGADGNILAGTAVYTPAAGTVESAPGAAILSVTFTPADTANYTTVAASVTLWVLAPLATTPYNWQSVKIVAGGFTPAVYFHPAEKGLMYLRADVGGAYRWDTASQHWIPLTDWLGGTDQDWSLNGVESIALDPSDPERVYLAAGMYIGSWLPINGAILVSTDRGGTFQRVNLPFRLGANDNFGQQGGERLAVNPFQPNELYLGSHENGLWRCSSSSTRGTMAPCTWAPTPGASTAQPTTAPPGSRCPASPPSCPTATRRGRCAARSVRTACCM
jgi:hypothetical protein